MNKFRARHPSRPGPSARRGRRRGVYLSVSPALLLLAHLFTAADGTVQDADWIKQHFRECCGKEDCTVAVPGTLHFTPAGWKVDGFGTIVRQRDVKRSLDGKPWVCRYLWEDQSPPAKRRVRCLFLPKARG